MYAVGGVTRGRVQIDDQQMIPLLQCGHGFRHKGIQSRPLALVALRDDFQQGDDTVVRRMPHNQGPATSQVECTGRRHRLLDSRRALGDRDAALGFTFSPVPPGTSGCFQGQDIGSRVARELFGQRVVVCREQVPRSVFPGVGRSRPCEKHGRCRW